METVSLWGYSVKVSDAIAFVALLLAGAALWVSWLAYRVNRNSLSLYEGQDASGMVLYVTNNSPHAVTVSSLGFVGPDGRASSLLGEDGLRLRIDPRDEGEISLNDDMQGAIRRATRKYSRHCLFVVLATGHAFYSVRRSRRFWWLIRGGFDGSRRLRHRQSQL